MLGLSLPVLVVDEKKMKRVGGISVVVLMKKVAAGRTAGGFEQAVGIRCRQVWCKHKMSREQLVGITGQRVQTDGDKEAAESYEKRQMLWKGMAGRSWSELVQQWCIRER